MITIVINNQTTANELQAIALRVKNPSGLMLAVGREGVKQLKAHFRDRNRTPNKLGGKRENFWARVGQSVQVPTVDQSGRTVTISINDERFAQKVFGGTITAKRTRNLAIPQTAEAYGRSPSTLEEEEGIKLFLVKTRNGIGLARALSIALGSSGGAGIVVDYILTPSVHQDPDPEALPNQSAFEAALIARAQKVANRQLLGGKRS